MIQPLGLQSNLKRLSKFSTGTALALIKLGFGCVLLPIELPHPGPSVGASQPPSSVSDRVLTAAAQELGLPQAELSWLRVNEEIWTDSCLGIGDPSEICLQMLVDGWQVEVVYNNQSWFYRTDGTGDNVRQSYAESNLPPSLSHRVLTAAANNAGTAMEQLEIISAEPRDWSNGCLELEKPGEACTEMLVFGWQVTVMGEGRSMVYHTDMIGDQIRLNAQASSR